jgi:hypothetical protein
MCLVSIPDIFILSNSFTLVLILCSCLSHRDSPRPNEPPPLALVRFDYYENIGKLSHFGTTDMKESRKVRHSGSFIPVKSMLFVNKPTTLTKELGAVVLYTNLISN